MLHISGLHKWHVVRPCNALATIVPGNMGSPTHHGVHNIIWAKQAFSKVLNLQKDDSVKTLLFFVISKQLTRENDSNVALEWNSKNEHI